MTEKFKKPERPGSMSDGDRALGSKRQRAADRIAGIPAPFDPDEDSMPILVDDNDDPTPVENPRGVKRRKRMTPQQFAEEIKTEVRELRAAVADLVEAKFNIRAELIERVIKVEARFSGLDDLAQSAEDLHALRGELISLRVQLVGVDGTNGRLGKLNDAVNKAHERAESGPRFVRRAIAVAGGAIVGSLVPAILFINSAVDKASSARADAAAETARIKTELEAGKADRAFLHQQLDSMLRLVRVGRAPSPSPGETP